MSSTELKLAHGTLTLVANVSCLPESKIGFHYHARGDSICYSCSLSPGNFENDIRIALQNERVNEDIDKHLSLVLFAAESLQISRLNTEPRDQLEHLPIMRAEYDAWQKVVKEFKTIDEGINNPKLVPLVRSIALWGEHLVALRLGQSANARSKAMTDAKITWDQAHQEKSE